MRVEPERIGAVLPSEPNLPNGRWARVSDHPSLSASHDRAVPAVSMAIATPGTSEATPESDAHAHESTAGAPITPHALPASNSESSAISSDIAVAASHEVPIARTPSQETRTPVTTGSHAVLPRRPPVLASEALLRDIAPSRPARRALRFWCPVLGALGTINAWFLTHGQGLGWPLAGAFFGLALLGLPPMPYPGRASAVTTVSATGLALLLWTDGSRSGGMANITLTLAVTLLASGLLFRAWHRASGLSRFMVAAGVLLSTLFLWMSGDVANLTLFDTAWQSWLPRLVGLAFCILLMLSLLAFMDARSTGGAAVWATFVLCWQALHSAVMILQAGWPKHEETFELSRIASDTLLVWTSTPLLSALLAIGLSQLMAAGLADATSRRTTPTLVPRANPLRDFTPSARTHQ